MDVSHSVFIHVAFITFSQTELNFIIRQPFVSFQTWLLWSEENVNFINFPTLDGV